MDFGAGKAIGSREGIADLPPCRDSFRKTDDHQRERTPAITSTSNEAPSASEKGLVIVADGVGGFNVCGLALARVAREAGLPLDVRVVRWGHGVGRWYADLSRTANHELQAERVAKTIRLHREAHPRAPVFLVGKSGGCAVLVKALERLSGAEVERLILLAPALSPNYDLTRALNNVVREAVVFWSPLDVLILGVGTGLFGTSDRVRGWGAGLVGFRRPSSSAPPDRIEAYKKLRQVRWSPRMSSTGYLGGHLGTDSPFFLKKYVLPLLRVEPARET